MMTIANKLLAGGFLIVAGIAWILKLVSNATAKGKAEAVAEANRSELDAMRERDDYIEEIENRNRGISDDELYSKLRSHADKSSD